MFFVCREGKIEVIGEKTFDCVSNVQIPFREVAIQITCFSAAIASFSMLKISLFGLYVVNASVFLLLF